MTLGVLALLGSGEIAPSMTKVHRQLLKRVDTVRAVSLDTAYGFQANVPQMTEKIVDYFATSLRIAITPLHFTVFEGSSEVERAAFRQDVRAANYVFAGPGSPSYALHQWAPLGLAEDLRGTLQAGGVLCFASAAALTLGYADGARSTRSTRSGTTAHWLHGLDVLAMVGIRGAIIPHYDNAEGGNYDTRFCYLGEERLVELERQLPDETGILGVDEHTAGIIDLEQKTLTVMGKGGVYWRRNGHDADLRERFGDGAWRNSSLSSPRVRRPPSAPRPELSDVDALVASAEHGGPESDRRHRATGEDGEYRRRRSHRSHRSRGGSPGATGQCARRQGLRPRRPDPRRPRDLGHRSHGHARRLDLVDQVTASLRSDCSRLRRQQHTSETEIKRPPPFGGGLFHTSSDDYFVSLYFTLVCSPFAKRMMKVCTPCLVVFLVVTLRVRILPVSPVTRTVVPLSLLVIVRLTVEVRTDDLDNGRLTGVHDANRTQSPAEWASPCSGSVHR